MEVISMCTLFFIIICTWGSLKHSAQKSKNRECFANMANRTSGSESIVSSLSAYFCPPIFCPFFSNLVSLNGFLHRDLC